MTFSRSPFGFFLLVLFMFYFARGKQGWSNQDLVIINLQQTSCRDAGMDISEESEVFEKNSMFNSYDDRVTQVSISQASLSHAPFTQASLSQAPFTQVPIQPDLPLESEFWEAAENDFGNYMPMPGLRAQSPALSEDEDEESDDVLLRMSRKNFIEEDDSVEFLPPTENSAFCFDDAEPEEPKEEDEDVDMEEKVDSDVEEENEEEKNGHEIDHDFISYDFQSVEEAFRYGQKGLGQLVVEKCKDIVYCICLKPMIFMVWNNRKKIWIEDSNGLLLRTKLSDYLQSEVEKILDDGDALDPKIVKLWERRLEILGKDTYTHGIVRWTAPYVYDQSYAQLFDSKKNLFPTAGNNVVDLTTGTITPRVKSDFFMFASPARFIPGMELSSLDDFASVGEFVVSIFPKKEDSDFLQTQLGSFTFGHVVDQLCHVWKGDRAGNGKTILLNLMLKIMTKFTFCQLAPGVVLKTGQSCNVGDELAKLEHKRLVVLSEPTEDAPLNTDMLKKLTGSEGALPAAKKYKAAADIEPECSVLFVANSSLKYDPDNGTNRRMCVATFPFYARDQQDDDFDPQDPFCILRDKDIQKKLEVDLDLFFTWVVLGAIRHANQGGLNNWPESVLEATRAMKKENDLVGGFLDENFEFREVERNQAICKTCFWRMYNRELEINLQKNRLSSLMLRKGHVGKRWKKTSALRNLQTWKKNARENLFLTLKADNQLEHQYLGCSSCQGSLVAI